MERPPVPLPGDTVKRLMRQHKVSIRDLSDRMQIPMKRIRQVRNTQLACRYAIRDWIETITGQDPGPL